MDAHLALQPFSDGRSLYEVLSELFTNESFDRFTAVVAWAKHSGIRRIRPLLEQFRARGGTCTILVGIDEGGATIEGLQSAISDFDHAHVLFDSSSGTFHPKIYAFAGQGQVVLILGSNNLTGGGLYFNYEASAILRLDLSNSQDSEIYSEYHEYVVRLINDATSIELNPDSLEYLRTDPRFKIQAENQSRSGDSLGAEKSASTDSVFGKSRHSKKRDPRRPDATGAKLPDALGQTGTPVEGGSTAPVALRWTKRLTRSDCGQPRPGSNTTNALRFTKARHNIDQATWFRHELFEDAAWLPDESRLGRERTMVKFEVEINGIARGTHDLPLKYDARREAGQHNFTTDLKWGSLSSALRNEDLVGEWISIAKLEDGSYRLTVAQDKEQAES